MKKSCESDLFRSFLAQVESHEKSHAIVGPNRCVADFAVPRRFEKVVAAVLLAILVANFIDICT